jgi:hypothetical protein
MDAYGPGSGQAYGPSWPSDDAVPPGTAVPAGPGGWDASSEPQRGRFDSFKPDAPEPPKAEPPTPQVRNGRVLLGVLTAAVLILVVPLGGLWLLGKLRHDEAPFIPEVGQCVRNEGDRPVSADCGAEGAFQVVSKVEQLEECPAPQQAHVVIPASDSNPRQVLCLQPAPTTTG